MILQERETMNVIIIDDDASSRINGIGTYLKALIGIFKRMGARITRVGYSASCKTFVVREENGVRVILLPPLPASCYFKIMDKFLGLYIKDAEENLFMLHYSPCDDLIRVLKKRFPLSKFTFTIHDMIWTALLRGDAAKLKEIVTSGPKEGELETYATVRKSFKAEQAMYALVDAVIVLARGTYRVLTDVYKIEPEKIYLIPNGLKDTYSPVSEDVKREIRADKFLSEHEKILLFAGRVHYMKGIHSLIRCFGQVLQAYPECRLVIAGFVMDVPKVLSLTGDAASRIIFTGHIPKKELDKWLKITDIGVLPSYTEQCCYWGIELMMHRIPVITTDGFNLTEMFMDGLNAGVAEIGHRGDTDRFEHNLSGEIVRLLRAEGECRKLGAQGRLVYEKCYTAEIMYENYKRLTDALFLKADK